MDEHLEWSAGQKSCWGLTMRVLAGFAGAVTIAWMAGIIGAGHAEVVAAVAN